ncbi:MAG: hypothetical protein NVS1B13_23840 [Flavisolibacter sp.]
MVSSFTQQILLSLRGRRLGLFLALFMVVSTVSGQVMSVDDLLHIARTSKRLDPFLKDFRFKSEGMVNNHDSIAFLYSYAPPAPLELDSTKPAEKIFRQILKFRLTGGELVRFQTSLLREDMALLEELKNKGFSYTENKNDYLFQKGSISVHSFSRIIDSNFLYTYEVFIKQLPKAAAIVYAEDLFLLNSHEYLSAVYGPTNTKKDLFYLPGGKTTPCTVLFPNTKQEAVFVWADGPNYKNLLALRIGGDPKTKSLSGYQRSIEQNVWQSREGIYIGMSIRELKKLSEGNMVSSNNFKNNNGLPENYTGKMGLILGCMNCGGAQYLQADYRSVSAPLEEGKKIYLSTMIFAGNTEEK